jgi:hypothetical protein
MTLSEADQEMEHRAARCGPMTHWLGCDCHEWQRRQNEIEVERLRAEIRKLVAATLCVSVGPQDGNMYRCNYCHMYIISPDEHTATCPIAILQNVLYGDIKG